MERVNHTDPPWRRLIYGSRVVDGQSNATSESLNRLARLEARLAYGFRNPANQRRRVRIACTRGRRRKPRTATSNRTHAVTGPKPHPG